ncbi:MAG: Bax inhibitor-1/YccA family protein [Alphaproteobacteria bacterium]|nr:Bax inhibitor-1/YccA family protein [Alphaproteobacteria bacterium]
MANEFERRMAALSSPADAVIDEGLRAYMLRVYNYMTSALALSGIVGWLVMYTPLGAPFAVPTPYGLAPTMLGYVAMFAPLGLVFYLSFRINKMSAARAQTAFWIFAGVMGISLGLIVSAYTPVSVVRVFFITAATFGAMSLYGYTTKRSLASWGSFLFMGLIGIIIAMVVNMFLQSSALYFAISVIGVLIFVGLTAYDTQVIKEMYSRADDSEVAGKKAIMGALRLYLDFINLFIMLLRLFGVRR